MTSVSSNPGSLNNMKPRALQELELMLAQELRMHHCPTEGPDPQRLQVHREVFGQLIEDFKIYKPLLSLIRTEYEVSIAGLKVRARGNCWRAACAQQPIPPARLPLHLGGKGGVVFLVLPSVAGGVPAFHSHARSPALLTALPPASLLSRPPAIVPRHLPCALLWRVPLPAAMVG